MRVDFGLELAALDLEHQGLVRQWRNDYQIYRWSRQVGPISDEEHLRWFMAQDKDPTTHMFIIQTRFDGKRDPLGVCGLTSIDWLNRRAEFSIYIAPDKQRRGFGRESLRLLLEHGFQNMGLSQIWGESFAGNPAMKIFDDLGFRRDGIRRSFYFKDGVFQDAHLFSMLSEEWRDAGSSLRGAGRSGDHRRDGERADDLPPSQGEGGGQPAIAAAPPAQEEAQAPRSKRGRRVGEGAAGRSGATLADRA